MSINFLFNVTKSPNFVAIINVLQEKIVATKSGDFA